MKSYCFALDLKEDEKKIAAYDEYHRKVWPEVRESLRQAGILEMEIYRTFNRLFMIIHTRPDFSFERKASLDAANPQVQEWETLMAVFQQPLPWAEPGQKWILMDRVFHWTEKE